MWYQCRLRHVANNNQSCAVIGRWLSSCAHVYTGGTACPRHIMDKLLNTYGVDTVHLWGMTELSPLGTMTHTTRRTDLSPEAQMDLRSKQGQTTFGVEMKLRNDAGEAVPCDGEQPGKLFVRGYAVCKGYFRGDETNHITHDNDGWLDTGDIATIDPDSYLQITDRAKDVIKSGGEWISSIALENLAMAHPDVAEAAAIAMPDEKWGERPLLVAVKKPSGQTVNAETLLQWYEGKVVNWWRPDRVVFVDELPHTATGKVRKSLLRTRLNELLTGA